MINEYINGEAKMLVYFPSIELQNILTAANKENRDKWKNLFDYYIVYYLDKLGGKPLFYKT